MNAQKQTKKTNGKPRVETINRAITKAPTEPTAIQQAVKTSLVALATMVGAALQKPDLYGPVFSFLKSTKENVTKLHDTMRDALKAYVYEHGEQTTEAGQLVAKVGAWNLVLRPRAKPGTLDAAKVEALLRSKGLSPDQHMDREVAYVLNPTKWESLIKAGKVSDDEAKGCEKPVEYNVMAPELDPEG